VLNERDAQIRKALESFDDARRLAELRAVGAGPGDPTPAGGEARARTD
jgi:hypothetical protein